MYKRLIEFINENGLLYRCEFGFQKGTNTDIESTEQPREFWNNPADTWRKNNVATSFWRHNGVIIASCARWVNVVFCQQNVSIFVKHWMGWYTSLTLKWYQK